MMQITLNVSRLLKYSLLVVSALIIGLLYWHLSKKVCLLCPIEISLDYTSTDGVRTIVNSEGIILLFRGVHNKHPDLPNAKMGVATPIGGHDDPFEHNLRR